MRIAVKDAAFTPVYYSAIEEFSDLTVSVYNIPAAAALDSATPDPNVTLPGAQTATFVFDEDRQYLLHWSSVVHGVDLWERVAVLASEEGHPVYSAATVGRAWFPALVYADGHTVTLELYNTSSMSEVGGSPFSCTYYYGEYIPPAGIILTESGTYLGLWYVDGVYNSFTVEDVFQPTSARYVSVGLLDRDGTPYVGARVTFTLNDGSKSTTTITDGNGWAHIILEEATYFVTVRDVNNPTRIFDHNNWELEVIDPVDSYSENSVVYDLDYLDAAALTMTQVSASDTTTMMARVRVGPDGSGPQYRVFRVELLDTWYDTTSGLVVVKGSQSYKLDDGGACDVTLIRGTRVKLSFPFADLSTTFTVPDQSSFYLHEIDSDDPFAVVIPEEFTPTRTSP